MLNRPEALWIRSRIRDALREAGLHLWGEQLEDALTAAAVSLVLEDRGTSAQMIHQAAAAFGHLDNDQLAGLADAVQFRHEVEPGVTLYDPDNEGS